MTSILQPIKADSLIEVFVSRFEELILSGKLKVGQKLPSERELAMQLGVSRPVVHEGLLVLAHKGLVTMKPRAGSVVNDFRRNGSVNLLTSLINHKNHGMDPELLSSTLEMRRLMEVENARLAALHRTEEQLAGLLEHLKREQALDPGDISEVCEQDFEFHLQVAMASGNLIYPMMLNSFRPLYLNLTSQFFTIPGVLDQVVLFHGQLVEAIRQKSSRLSAGIMEQILDHGKTAMLHLMDNSSGRM